VKARGGAVVNISSASAFVVMAGNPHYAAAKAGILGFTRSVAAELAPFGVRVNAVCPGVIETPASTGFRALQTMLASQVPLGRIGQPREIADVVAFLVSDASSYMTGQSLEVNGGIRG
jgi:3-oxoacyl-[acyl-carrier protein] reductase